MTLDTALFDPTQVYLEIDPATQERAWRQSQSFATPSSQWNAYLNQLCLSTILAWIREDYDPRTAPYPNPASLASFWEVVNGTAISVGSTRLVLLPTEAIDLDEFRVLQEWVDIPGWTGDYYLSVQVSPDDGWVRINGFTTHQQIKTKGSYHWDDRTYSLDESDLVTDISALWVAQQIGLAEPTRSDVPALTVLPLPQAQNLIQRLGNPELLNPRLAIPFSQWGSLISNGGWRQQLTERRRGLPEQRSPLTWLQSGVSTLAQQWGWGRVDFQPSLAASRGETAVPTGAISRQVTIAEQAYELRIVPVTLEANTWRFELRNLAPGGLVPAGYTLRLLTEDLQPFENNEDTAQTATECLFLEVALEPGEGIIWETAPLPEGYETEILRF